MFGILFGCAENIIISKGGGQGSYGGNFGWNLRGELDFTNRMETMSESGVRELDLVTRPSPPHQDGKRQWSQRCVSGPR